MMVHWITFLLTSTAIVLAGIKLASFGEAIGVRSRIGQGWIGLLFLATITSIPELTTTVTGATIGVPNIALGNALGSNLFNIAIIAVMDILLLGRGPFLRLVKPYHAASGGMAILLTVLVMLGITVAPNAAILGVNPISFIILFTYVAGVFLLYRIEKRDGGEAEGTKETMGLRRAIVGFCFSGGVIIVSGIFLIYASKAIAEETALSASFMGAILVAIATSLPELATSIGALKIKAYDHDHREPVRVEHVQYPDRLLRRRCFPPRCDLRRIGRRGDGPVNLGEPGDRDNRDRDNRDRLPIEAPRVGDGGRRCPHPDRLPCKHMLNHLSRNSCLR
jgi:cation:H+ antiporter